MWNISAVLGIFKDAMLAIVIGITMDKIKRKSYDNMSLLVFLTFLFTC